MIDKIIDEIKIKIKSLDKHHDRIVDIGKVFQTIDEVAEKHKEQEHKWIPVKEGLPENNYECVLVYLDTNCYDIAVWHSEYKFRPWYCEYFQDCTPEWNGKVIAWTPLPKCDAFDGKEIKADD